MRALGFPFRIVPGGRTAECATYDEIIRGQVIDALMTNQGERVFRPRYGCDIQSALFDPTDELVRRDAASYIKARLQQFVVRASIRSVTIDLAPEPNMVIVNVVYRSAPFASDTTIT